MVDVSLYTSGCKEGVLLFESLHLLFGSLWDADSYSPLHSQESIRRLFDTLCKLVLVVSYRLR